MNQEKRYLEILAEMYPTISAASTEIINLQSILNLPKGTEHFMSDIHGEFDAFSHVLRNGSGAVRKKIDDVFGHTLGMEEKMNLATLIYYPEEKIEIEKAKQTDMENWYQVSLYRLIEVCKQASSKYTRSKVRKTLPNDFAYIIEELITEKPEVLNKEAYYAAIVNTIVEIGQAEDFIVALAELIQRLVIDHLHIIGDIFDRGSGPHFIMDTLCEYHSLDIQWGNHDIVWMGAAVGQKACVASVIRNSIRYGNIDVLEDGYGINLMPLATFAMDTYRNDPCEYFKLKNREDNRSDEELMLAMKMHKAIMVIKMKLEGQMMQKYPEFGMEHRKILDQIDYQTGVVDLDGTLYPILDNHFPTIDPYNPFTLTEEEEAVITRLQSSFRHCEKLQRHMKLLLKKGSMYKIYNGNLMYHGCVPMDENGDFKKVTIFGESYSGKKLFDVLDTYVRKAFFSLDPVEQQKSADILWFLWCAPDSPLYGRKKMATFEHYLIEDTLTHKEEKNYYYSFFNEKETVVKILKEFGLDGDDERSHIINGHVPVHRASGEKPVKADGKLLVIDGGFSKTYRKRTGIAGYTLVFNSYGLTLTAHEPFESAENAIQKGVDIVSKQEAVQYVGRRLLVGDTDSGEQFKQKIEELKELIQEYRLGELTQSI